MREPEDRDVTRSLQRDKDEQTPADFDRFNQSYFYRYNNYECVTADSVLESTKSNR